MQLPHIPPYKTKVVEPIYFRNKAERAAKIKEVQYNLFNLHSDWVIIDLMTDSGTGAMSEQQWAEIIFPQIPISQYPAQVLGVETYIEGGIRGVEIGTLLADRDPETGKDRSAKMELLRLAIPRRVYSRNHMDYVAMAIGNVMDRRENITSGFRIKKQAPILRHFTVALERI